MRTLSIAVALWLCAASGASAGLQSFSVRMEIRHPVRIAALVMPTVAVTAGGVPQEGAALAALAPLQGATQVFQFAGHPGVAVTIPHATAAAAEVLTLLSGSDGELASVGTGTVTILLQ